MRPQEPEADSDLTPPGRHRAWPTSQPRRRAGERWHPPLRQRVGI